MRGISREKTSFSPVTAFFLAPPLKVHGLSKRQHTYVALCAAGRPRLQGAKIDACAGCPHTQARELVHPVGRQLKLIELGEEAGIDSSRAVPCEGARRFAVFRIVFRIDRARRPRHVGRLVAWVEHAPDRHWAARLQTESRERAFTKVIILVHPKGQKGC